ncbi:hypothetical protein [Streptomyces sp. 8K308]|uniref:hypothetical protein n=1 Tax=Streptomyces sp. 8K308 TaxID=2530388 RepID=UPI001A9D170A|nr:hypothetical protein [Streptomyces sp. 8K308]
MAATPARPTSTPSPTSAPAPNAALVNAFTGRDLPAAADVDTQLRLIHDHLIPALT